MDQACLSSTSNALVFSVCQLAFWSSSVVWRLFLVVRVQHQALRDQTCDGRCCSCRSANGISQHPRRVFRSPPQFLPLLGLWYAVSRTSRVLHISSYSRGNSRSPRIRHSLVRRRSRQTIQMSRLKAVSTAESTS